MRRYHLGAISIVAFMAMCCGLIKSTHAEAILTGDSAAFAWTGLGTNLEVKLDKQNTSDSQASYWNIPCANTQHKEYNPSQGGLRTIDDCLQTTSYGKVGADILLSDSDTGHVLRDTNGALLNNFHAIPGTKDLLFMTGARLYVYRNFPENFKTLRGTLGNIEYLQLTKSPWLAENRIHFNDGSGFAGFQPGSFNFSADGNHMVLNQGRYQVVVDLQTLVAKTFGTTSMRSWGTTAQLRTSVNYNGRIAFTADSEFEKYFLYDLNSCSGSGIDQPQDCKKRDLRDFLHQKIPGLRFVSTSKFVSEDTIEFHAIVSVGDRNQTNRYRLTLPGSEASNFDYIAMGDSYSSGEGARNYKDGTDTTENGCHVSSDSYPYLISRQLGHDKAASVACSGAKIKDIYMTKESDYVGKLQQADGKDANTFDEGILTNFLPGYRTQNLFINRYKPRNITLSIGGNDVGFSEIVGRCTLPGNCYSSDNEKAEIVAKIKAQFPRLVNTYQQVVKAAPNSHLYVFGYPYVADSNGRCALNVLLSPAERQLAQDLITDINSTVELAAKKAGVGYIDVSNALVGHRLCEDLPWKVAINGALSNSKISNKFIARESYHPNALGHQLMANTILEKTQNFTLSMPAPDDSIGVSQLQSKLLPNVSTDDLPIPYLEEEVSPTNLLRTANITSIINPEGYLLNTGATYSVELHSSPVAIGSATVINPAELQITATIPENTTPGMHAIHIYGTDVNGKSIDIYKPITVHASESDADGDGINNQNDQCYFIEPAGIDSDQDGVDDACDDFISQPPVSEEVPLVVDPPSLEDSDIPLPSGVPPQNESNAVPVSNDHTYTTGPEPEDGTSPPVGIQIIPGADTHSGENPGPEAAGLANTLNSNGGTSQNIHVNDRSTSKDEMQRNSPANPVALNQVANKIIKHVPFAKGVGARNFKLLAVTVFVIMSLASLIILL